MADREFDIDDVLAELDQEDADEQVAAAAAEAEQKADAEDAKPPKRTRVEERVDALEKKYEQDALQSAINRFKEHADEVELEIFEAARKDEPLKSLTDFEAAAEVAKRRASALRETEERLAKEAEERVAKAWGSGPVGAKAAPADAEKEVMERISQGDTHALLESLLANDMPF